MNISPKLKERFCKDCNIPIKLFQEPYFTDRLTLYDPFYDTLRKYEEFTTELSKYTNEQDYFEEYNRVKDFAINDIKSTNSYQQFNTEDMNRFAIDPAFRSLPGKDIFKTTNDGRTFISVDMKKANFSALKAYDSAIFGYAKTWEEFIGRYTKNKHIINSKYIRQVILGNCNPKRHITYEKWIMSQVTKWITDKVISLDHVVFFSNDEIIFDITGLPPYSMESLYEQIKREANGFEMVPFKTEMFILHKINGTDGYIKEIFDESGTPNIDFKCLDNYMLPFVICNILKQPVTDSDKTFYHEGLLAKFIEIPEIGPIDIHIE